MREEIEGRWGSSEEMWRRWEEGEGRRRARVRKGGAAGLLGFSGPAWLDRPKRPAGLLFSPSYSFPFTKKNRKEKEEKEKVGVESGHGDNFPGLTKMSSIQEK